MADIERDILNDGNWTLVDMTETFKTQTPCGLYVYNTPIIWKPSANNETQQWVSEDDNTWINPDYNIVMYIQWALDRAGFEEIFNSDYNYTSLLNLLKTAEGVITLVDKTSVPFLRMWYLGYLQNQADVEALGFKWYTPSELGAIDGVEYQRGYVAGIAADAYTSINELLFHPVRSRGNTTGSNVCKIYLENYAEDSAYWTDESKKVAVPKLFTPYLGYYYIGGIESANMIVTLMWLGVQPKNE